MVDKVGFGVDSDSERRQAELRQAELVSAFAKPATMYFAPSQVVTTKDVVSKASATASKPTYTTPPLDAPPDAGHEVVKEVLNGLQALLNKSRIDDSTNVDDILHAILLGTQEVFTENLANTRAYFELERKFSEAVDKQRLDVMKDAIAASNKVSTWKTVENSLFAFGLIAAGIAGISMGMAPLGAAAIAFGVLNIVDRLLDNAAKEAVASWIARGDTESEKLWVERINLFCAATAIALSLGISAPAAPTYGLSLAKSAVGGIRTVFEWRQNSHKAFLVEMEAMCAIANKNVDAVITRLQNRTTDIEQLNENIHHIRETNYKLTSLMMQAVR